MKKLCATFALIGLVSLASAQCFVQVQTQSVLCYGDCNGAATAYPVNMVSPVTYLWMPGGQTTQSISNQCAGTYTLQATDSTGCFASAIVTITQPTQLQVSISNIVNPSCPTCCDGSMDGMVNGGTPAYSFLWTGPNGYSSPWVSNSDFCAGTYTLCVTDQNGCVSCTSDSVSFTTEIEESNSATQLSVFSVGNGIFNLYTNFQSAQSGEIIVTNVMGQDVLALHFSSGASLSNPIDLSDQPAGMYFVSVITASGVSTVRLVKQ